MMVNNDELKTVVNNWYKFGMAAAEYNMEIAKLMNRYDKWLNVVSNYVEKLLKINLFREGIINIQLKGTTKTL